jgi:hypothetical protein
MDGRQPSRLRRIRSGAVVACVRRLTACRSSVVVRGGHSDWRGVSSMQPSLGNNNGVLRGHSHCAPHRRSPPPNRLSSPAWTSKGLYHRHRQALARSTRGQIGEYSRSPLTADCLRCATVPAPRRSCNPIFSRSEYGHGYKLLVSPTSMTDIDRSAMEKQKSTICVGSR